MTTLSIRLCRRNAAPSKSDNGTLLTNIPALRPFKDVSARVVPPAASTVSTLSPGTIYQAYTGLQLQGFVAGDIRVTASASAWDTYALEVLRWEFLNGELTVFFSVVSPGPYQPDLQAFEIFFQKKGEEVGSPASALHDDVAMLALRVQALERELSLLKDVVEARQGSAAAPAPAAPPPPPPSAAPSAPVQAPPATVTPAPPVEFEFSTSPASKGNTNAATGNEVHLFENPAQKEAHTKQKMDINSWLEEGEITGSITSEQDVPNPVAERMAQRQEALREANGQPAGGQPTTVTEIKRLEQIPASAVPEPTAPPPAPATATTIEDMVFEL